MGVEDELSRSSLCVTPRLLGYGSWVREGLLIRNSFGETRLRPSYSHPCFFGAHPSSLPGSSAALLAQKLRPQFWHHYGSSSVSRNSITIPLGIGTQVRWSESGRQADLSRLETRPIMRPRGRWETPLVGLSSQPTGIGYKVNIHHHLLHPGVVP